MLAMTSKTTAQTTSLRATWWMAFAWLVGLMVLLTGVCTVTIDASMQDMVFGGLLMGVPGAWVTFRVPLMRVTLTTAGLTDHGLFRNRTFAWADVERVHVEQVNDYRVATAYAPVLDLSTHADSHALMQLAGYSTKKRVTRARVTHQSNLIGKRLSEFDRTLPGGPSSSREPR